MAVLMFATCQGSRRVVEIRGFQNSSLHVPAGIKATVPTSITIRLFTRISLFFRHPGNLTQAHETKFVCDVL
jgi:hypothetical protein